MKLSVEDLNGLMRTAQEAAREAGERIRSKCGEPIQVESKDQGSTLASRVVTEVDRASQDLIVGRLRETMDRYPFGMLSEESADDSSRLKADYFWCVDPLDGTLSFVRGRAGYSVSIALVSREGKAVLGVIHDPVSGDIFQALEGRGAYKNGKRIEIRESPNEGPMYWLMDQSMKSLGDFSQLTGRLEEIAEKHGCSGLRIIDSAGAALNAAWVTQHASALYFKLPKPEAGGGSYWDFAASTCLLQEWGLPATDIHGSPLNLNRPGTTFMNEHGVIYASRAELGNAVRALYLEFDGNGSV